MWQKIRSFLRLEQENLQICPEVWWFFLVSFESHLETKQKKSRCWTLEAQQLQLKESHLLLVKQTRTPDPDSSQCGWPGGTSRALTNLRTQTGRVLTTSNVTHTGYMKVFRAGSVTHCVCPRQKDWMLYGDLRWLTLIFSSRSAVMMNLSSGDMVWTTGGHADHSDSLMYHCLRT